MITIVSILRKNMYGVFVLRHYLFLEAHSFPRASLSENCLYLQGDNVHKQISTQIFLCQIDTIVHLCMYVRVILAI